MCTYTVSTHKRILTNTLWPGHAPSITPPSRPPPPGCSAVPMTRAGLPAGPHYNDSECARVSCMCARESVNLHAICKSDVIQRLQIVADRLSLKTLRWLNRRMYKVLHKEKWLLWIQQYLIFDTLLLEMSFLFLFHKRSSLSKSCTRYLPE